jgi:hypothetical protein
MMIYLRRSYVSEVARAPFPGGVGACVGLPEAGRAFHKLGRRHAYDRAVYNFASTAVGHVKYSDNINT